MNTVCLSCSIQKGAALRWVSRWVSPRQDLKCQATTPRREWGWGVSASAAVQRLYQNGSCSAIMVTQAKHTVHSSVHVATQDLVDGNSPAESQTRAKPDTAKEHTFIPLGVEAAAPGPPNAEASKAHNRAAWLLSQRMYTRHRLEQKLLSYKKFSEDAIAWAMQRVEAAGHIDDAGWSRDFAKQKWRYSKWAATRIRRELRQRGIDADTIENTLEWLQTEGQRALKSDGTFTSPAAGAEEAAANMQVVLVADARKRLVRLERYPVATRRRRISSWLARLGHDWGTTQHVLSEVDLL